MANKFEQKLESFKQMLETSSPEILKGNMYHPDKPMDGNPIIAYKNHLARIARAIETNAILAIPTQSALKAMNPGPVGTGKILNPAFLFGAPPGQMGMVSDSEVDPNGSPIPDNDVRRDILKADSLARNEENRKYNLYTDEPDGGADQNFYVDTVEETVDIDAIFERRSTGFDFGTGEKGYKGYKPKREAKKRNSTDGDRRNYEFAISQYDSMFSSGDIEKGYVGPIEFDSIGIEDASNYLPFYLEDMRMSGANKRRVYFRAFFKGLRESISPSWTQENYFGRVDPAGIYTGTSRTVNVSFALVSISRSGFTTMWKKVNQLAKALYPTFINGVMVKAPVYRIRIGDLICDETGEGLPGYICSAVDLDYTNSTWEISKWVDGDISKLGKAPQIITVSFTFQVIHERNPQVDGDGNFNTSLFRRIGKLSESEVSAQDGEGEDQ